MGGAQSYPMQMERCAVSLRFAGKLCYILTRRIRGTDIVIDTYSRQHTICPSRIALRQTNHAAFITNTSCHVDVIQSLWDMSSYKKASALSSGLKSLDNNSSISESNSHTVVSVGPPNPVYGFNPSIPYHGAQNETHTSGPNPGRSSVTNELPPSVSPGSHGSSFFSMAAGKDVVGSWKGTPMSYLVRPKQSSAITAQRDQLGQHQGRSHPDHTTEQASSARSTANSVAFLNSHARPAGPGPTGNSSVGFQAAAHPIEHHISSDSLTGMP